MAQTPAAKPTFKAPDKPPMSPPLDMLGTPMPQTVGLAMAEPTWKPMSTAPHDPEKDSHAKFMVRATTLNKDGERVPVGGTETLVRYRMSRARSGNRWVPALTLIDDRTGTKLGFRPNEWCEVIPANG